MRSTDANTGPVRTIALMNQKGGVGKTTTTVSLGAAMARHDCRVLLVDLDPQAHLTLHLGIEPEPDQATVYDLLVDDDVTARDVIVNAREKLDVIPAEVDLAGAEVELADAANRQLILTRKLASITGNYDYILLDCPPSLGLLTLNALALAQEVFVPMQAHFLALQGVGKLLETVGLVCQSVNPSLAVTAIILCLHEGQTTLAREIVADLDGFFDAAREQDVPWRSCRVLRPAIRRNIKLAEAPSFGQTIFDYSPWCAGANDYRKLARRVIDEWNMAQSGRNGEMTAHRADAECAAPEAPPAPVITIIEDNAEEARVTEGAEPIDTAPVEAAALDAAADPIELSSDSPPAPAFVPHGPPAEVSDAEIPVIEILGCKIPAASIEVRPVPEIVTTLSENAISGASPDQPAQG